MDLDNGEIHIWSDTLQESRLDYNVINALLSQDEQARAKRFYRRDDGFRYVMSRVRLRSLLAEYTRIPVKDITFCYGPNGKPGLLSKASWPNIHFSISHTSGLTLFAFALGEEVGVDIETAAHHIDVQAASKRFLGAAELAHFNSTPSDNRKSLFFKYWTRKEACLKLLGIGLSVEPQTIDVSKPPIVWVKADSSSEHRPEYKILWLMDLQLDGGYMGACALAGSGPPKAVRHFHCDHAIHTFAGAEVPH